MPTMTTKPSSNILRLIRPDIRAMIGYEPIEPIDVLAKRLGIPDDKIAKLDGNENPYGPSPRVLEELGSFDAYHRYPDPEQRHLRAALSEYVGVGPEYIVAGHGSDEIIDLLLRALLAPGEAVIDCPPTFGMYGFSARVAGGKVIDVPRKEDFSIDIDGIRAVAHDAKAISLASPNNPTGNVLRGDELEALLATDLLVVVDEAYVEFSGESYAKLVLQHENLVVLRTFKQVGRAGRAARGLWYHAANVGRRADAHQASVHAEHRGRSGDDRVAGGAGRADAHGAPARRRARAHGGPAPAARVRARVSFGGKLPALLPRRDGGTRRARPSRRTRPVRALLRYAAAARLHSHQHGTARTHRSRHRSAARDRERAMPNDRRATTSRETKETKVSVTLDLDGRGDANVSTGIGMLDHLLSQIAKHGIIDIALEAKGDLHIDEHHTVEDIGLALGKALDDALGSREGIVRMADALVPLDEALASVAVDLSGRGYAVLEVEWTDTRIGELPADLLSHLLWSLASEGKFNLHARVLAGVNDHHKAEAAFKALGRALGAASRLEPRRSGSAPSTKGTLRA